jgi:hypothetical protein
MGGDALVQLLAAFFAGIGLLLIGCVNLALRRKAARYRVIATFLIAASAIAGVWASTEKASAAERSALLLAGCAAICFATGSDRLFSAAARIASAVRRPAARWSLLAAIGLATALGSVLYNDYQSERTVDFQMAELEQLNPPPPPTAPGADRAFTDLGHPVDIREAVSPRDDATLYALEECILRNPALHDQFIRHQPATDRSNCHGWVFTGGRYWVVGHDVDHILTENRYRPVADPKPRDLIVYRSGATVLHSGVVRYVTEGQPVLVESKWGCTGVFLHAADGSFYGSSFTYYRSPREGHLLAGLVPVPSPESSPHHLSAPNMPDRAHIDGPTE